MQSPSGLHPGLPHVPPPARDELLGAWLLRVAQPYGLGLPALVARLAPRRAPDTRVPRWFALHGGHVDVASLASALRVSAARLVATAPPGCRPNWPSELGLCARCLEQSALAGEPLTWKRSWMHPLATVCAVHHLWLTPVATAALRRIRHADELERLAAHPPPADGLDGEPPIALLKDALWLQQRCQQRASVQAPWGSTSPALFTGIASTVAQLMMSVGAEQMTHRPTSGDAEPAKSFTLDRSGRRSQWRLSNQLRERQWLLGHVGQRLRQSESIRLAPWPAAVVRELANSGATQWPVEALEWICPQAADVVRQRVELRAAFGISPRYFKACSAIFASLR